GVELLSYLSYLVLFVFIVMSILSRLTLEGLSVKRTLGQSYAHLGDTIELAYELTNDHSLGKLWLEVFEKSNWPEPLPGRVLSIGGRKTRKWKLLAKAQRRGRFRLGPIVLRSGDPFGLSATEARAASVVRKALDGHRNVGLVTNGNRAEVLHPDRGSKQFGKLMQYLAEVHAGGTRTLQETLVETLPRLRRGASCLLITPSLDRAWVRPASTLRETAIATQAVIVSPPFDLDERDRARRRAILGELAVAGVLAGTLPGNGQIRFMRAVLAGGTLGMLMITLSTTFASTGGAALRDKLTHLAILVNNWITQVLAGEAASDPTVFVLFLGASV